MTVDDFVAQIDGDTAEEILGRADLKTLATTGGQLRFNAALQMIFTGAEIKSVGVMADADTGNNTVIIYAAQGNRVFGFDFQSKFGATVAEMIPPEPLEI